MDRWNMEVVILVEILLLVFTIILIMIDNRKTLNRMSKLTHDLAEFYVKVEEEKQKIKRR